MAETKFLDNVGLTHLFEKINAKFSKLGHTHTKSDITDFTHSHNDLYYGKAEVDSKLSGKSNTSHTHDDRYYTESEINAKLAAEAKDRKDADAALDTAYKAADTALGSRIDNAETEISANSADLTGIKGLTYGTQHVNFMESSNGEYSSPALEEIAEQIAQGMTCIQIQSDATTMDADTLNKLSSNWPNVALIDTTPDPNDSTHNFKFPVRKSNSHYRFIAIGGHYREGHPYATNIVIKKTGEIIRQDVTNDPYWSNITGKPFSTIGSGLKVVSNALTVDASAHNHNDLYYQKSEIDGKLSGKAAASHKHGAADITSVNASAINGVIAAANLPSFVDDVIEGYLNSGKFYKEKKTDGTYATEITAETGKIYVNLNNSKTYRWSGSAYVVISETIALGETSSTAYRGDRGAAAYNHAAAKGSAFANGLYKITTNAQGHVTAATAVQKSDITALGIPAQDTVYTHPTSSGNKHIPSGGSAGQFLKWSADGTAVWAADNNTWNALRGATASAAGSAGYVAAPAKGQQGYFLRGDATWAAISKGTVGLGNVDNTADSNKSVKYAASAGSASSATKASTADSATKATQDSAGQQINTTYIKGLSVSGRTVTYTRGDGTTGTITTQDTNTTYNALTNDEIDAAFTAVFG